MRLRENETLLTRSVSQRSFTCAKLIETLEEGVEYVQSNNKDIRTTPMTSF